MLGLVHLTLHVIAYSSFGIVLYSLRNRLSLIPFYLYLGILQVLVSMMSSFYVLDIGWGISVGGGSIVYSAVIWSVMLLYIMERDLSTIKMLIIGLFVIQITFLFLYPYYALLLESSLTTNPLSIPSAIFETSFGIFWIGNLLALAELIIMVFLLERVRTKFSRIPPALIVIVVYTLTLILDGVLFPLFAFPIIQSISIVQGIASVLSKILLGVLYSLMLVAAFVILEAQFMTGDEEVDLRLLDMLTLPKTEVVNALRRAEENQAMVQLLLDLLSHDLRNYNSNTLSLIEMIGVKDAETYQSFEESLSMIREIQYRSIDLVTNILTLSRIQEQKLEPEGVDLHELVENAEKRVSMAYSEVSMVIKNKETISDIHVLCHPLLVDVFYNLFSNSIKYRKPDQTEVVIELSILRSNQTYHLVVSDNGIGIPDDEKVKIFDNFAKRPRHQKFGLYLVKTILAKFNCDIWIENRIETPDDHHSGAAFHLRFPIV